MILFLFLSLLPPHIYFIFNDDIHHMASYKNDGTHDLRRAMKFSLLIQGL